MGPLPDSTEDDVIINGGMKEVEDTIEKAPSYAFVLEDISLCLEHTEDTETAEPDSQNASETGKTSYTLYQYDSVGNRTQVKEDGKTITYNYNGLNQLISSGDGTDTKSYTYDEAGNQTKVTDSKGNETAYTYDAKNQLVKVAQTTANGSEKILQENVYNGDGQRIQKTEGTQETNYFYQNGAVVKTTNREGN